MEAQGGTAGSDNGERLELKDTMLAGAEPSCGIHLHTPGPVFPDRVHPAVGSGGQGAASRTGPREQDIP